MACCAASLPLISGIAKAFKSASFNLFTTGYGVPLGATSPKNAIQFKSSRPTSLKVGTSGKAGARVSPDTARARSRPSSTSGRDVGRLS